MLKLDLSTQQKMFSESYFGDICMTNLFLSLKHIAFSVYDVHED